MPKSPEHRDLFSGALELMILHSLRVKPMHGYALVKHIKAASDELLQVEEGSLYPALQRMLKEGLLESEAGVSAKGRPTRIYKRHLKAEISSYEKMSTGISRVLAAVRS
jgi:PadR family transcriptional regulator PadR